MRTRLEAVGPAMRIRRHGIAITAYAASFLFLLAFSPLSGCGRSDDDSSTTGARKEQGTGGAGVTPQARSGDEAQRPLKIVMRRKHFTDSQLERLKAIVPNVKLVVIDDAQSPEHELRELSDADAFLTNQVTREHLRSARRLRWIQHYAAGVDRDLHPELVDSEIVLTNCKIIQGPEIADHGFALLLALTRRLNEIIPGQKSAEWKIGHYREPENWPLELQGRTALIIGMGGIGMQLAQRAHAFGMRVVGTDPKDMPYLMFVEAVYRPDELLKLLPQADVVFMTAPLTEETRYLLGAREFALMKRGAYFIALSRGQTFDATALADAIEQRHLAGAGLDVTDPSPLPKNHALWQMPNVIITPHMAGQSDRVWERRFTLVAANLERFAQNRPLLNTVDKRRGF